MASSSRSNHHRSARNSNHIGNHGEDLVACLYVDHGFEIVFRNWRAKDVGMRIELDLVVYDRANRELVVVEVKTRSSDKYGSPADAISRDKLDRMAIGIGIVRQFLEANGRPCRRCRLDVACVTPNKIEIIPNVGRTDG
jgi:putative endonuclease